jgi:hypothetical protein
MDGEIEDDRIIDLYYRVRLIEVRFKMLEFNIANFMAYTTFLFLNGLTDSYSFIFQKG